MTVTPRETQRFAYTIAECTTTLRNCHLGTVGIRRPPSHLPSAVRLLPSKKMLKNTPFHAIHVALHAKMVPFAGFEMPVQYPTGITAEHNAVRTKAGLFDVSHMGEFLVTGPQARRLRELRDDQQRRRARDQSGALLRNPERSRHVRRRLPRLSFCRSHHDGRQRVEQRQRLRAHLDSSSRSSTRSSKIFPTASRSSPSRDRKRSAFSSRSPMSRSTRSAITTSMSAR